MVFLSFQSSSVRARRFVFARNVWVGCRSRGFHGRVYDRRGCDRTDAFRQGASRVLEICLRQDIRKAVFKEKSPSCGVRMRYDGSFTGRLIPGEGLAVRLLRRHGIAVYSEEDIPDLFGLSAAKG